MNFSFDQLSKPILKAIRDIGYKEPTNIQASAIPTLLSSQGDFVGQAQTGTGKTAAFCLPLLEKIDVNKKCVQAIILTPTRELANQINQQVIKFSKYLTVKSATVYGGVSYKEQISNLNSAHLIIATPGRAIDLINKRKLNLKNVEYFIIDEADEMLEMGFIEDVEYILSKLSPLAKKWMFSATMPKPIIRLMESKLKSPDLVRLKHDSLSKENIDQSVVLLPKKEFFKALRAIIFSETDMYGIIFCETREETKRLTTKIVDLGKTAVALHGDLNQAQRDTAMEQFKSRAVSILVCTDVASRGIDVSDVTHVVNIGLPRKSESYIHRIGRTGRAGKLGKAISFVTPNERNRLLNIERLTKQKIEKYRFPKPSESKKIKVINELNKMEAIRKAVTNKREKFDIDENFEEFDTKFEELSKKETLQVIYTHLFNKDFRKIDESLKTICEIKPDRDKKYHNNKINKRRRVRK